MRRREEQSIDECWVENPQQMTEAVRTKACCRITTILGRGQGQGTAEELGVVAFIRLPYPDVVMEVFCKINEDTGNFANHIGRQMEGIVGEVILRFAKHLPKSSNDFGKVRIAFSSISLRAMGSVIHDIAFWLRSFGGS